MRQLNPVIEVPLCDGLVLQVTHTDERSPKVRCVLYNGAARAIDTFDPNSQRQRQRFAKAAVTAEPVLTEEAVDFALMIVAEDLAKPEAAATEEVEPAIAQAALEQQAAPLLAAPDLLRQYRRLVQACGLVGEERTALALYLAATARATTQPQSVAVKGPSSSGKSFALKTVLATLPDSAYVDYTTVSPKFLAYDQSPLPHRIVVLMEAPGLGSKDTPGGEMTAYVARSLISEGCIKTGTVERAEDGTGMAARTVTREGPAALWTTTTRASLDDELETRLLSLSVRDDLEQTMRVMEATAHQFDGQDRPQPDIAPWHALQHVVQSLAPCAVVLPFAGLLARQTDAGQVRARRDFGKLLSLIAASAILHHRQRRTDPQGRVVADVADYRHVHLLLGDTFRAIAAQGCTPAVAEAVRTVAALVKEQQGAVTVRQVANRLKIDRSAAARRVAVALGQGWLLDERDGAQTKQRLLRPGEALPEERPALPDPDLIAGAMPEYAVAPWVNPLTEHDDDPPPGNDRTSAQADPNDGATRGDGAAQLVQRGTAQGVHKTQAAAEADADLGQLVQACENGTAQAGETPYQGGTAAADATCALVQSESGETNDGCPRCGAALAKPWHALGYGDRPGAWCGACGTTVWLPGSKDGE